ncbi:MAG: hypothetical protein J9259_09695 [Thermoplasmata archaeon YP2-bin.285]|uniref:Uncharacterized protein n=1 Tax=Candidatus Sysuiplasma superficiale TaxID=2823368 RepID=A0A8J7YRW3_9ARCH|nr:hypothetical protein [Candidatus Sysuiplasma superficiale]
MVDKRKVVRKRLGNRDIRAGEKAIEKGLLGPRGYGVLKGTEDVAKGISKDRMSRKKK